MPTLVFSFFEDTVEWIRDFLASELVTRPEIGSYRDILLDWMRETDPANLQPSVRPLNHRVAAFIRANPPLDMSEERLNRALDISPWPRREEVLLRDWFDADERGGAALSRFLIDRILETGLEPVVPPRPLPPISPEDIDLLCWMGIQPQDDGPAQATDR